MTSTLRLAAATVAAAALVAGPLAAAAQAAPPPHCPRGCDVHGGGIHPQGWNHWEFHQHDHGGPGWNERDFGGLSTGSSGGPGGFFLGG